MSWQTAHATTERTSSSVAPVLAVLGYVAAILFALVWAVCLLLLPVLGVALMVRELWG